jgi:hypothetical protein
VVNRSGPKAQNIQQRQQKKGTKEKMLRKIPPETRTHDLLALGLAPQPTDLDSQTVIIPASIRYKSNQVGGRVEKVWGVHGETEEVYLFT